MDFVEAYRKACDILGQLNKEGITIGLRPGEMQMLRDNITEQLQS